MSGSITGRVNCVHLPTALKNLPQEIFVNIYNTFLTHPNMTLVARNGGLGGSASSVNFWDEADPFGNNAWFVFKMNTAVENPFYTGTRTFPWYVLVQWNRYDQGSFGSAPGNPGLSSGVSILYNGAEANLSVQFAIGVGGDQNPWNGAGTLGANTKGTPVWKIPTGGTDVYVWPRSNSSGGSHATNKENCSNLYHRPYDYATLGVYANIILDDDTFLFLHSWDGDGMSCVYFGPFTPAPNVTISYPMVMFGTGTDGGALPFSNTAVHGNLAGTGWVPTIYPGANTGGIVGPNGGVVGCLVDRYTQFLTNSTNWKNPNRYYTNQNTISDFPLMIYANEFPNEWGYAGQVDFIREVVNVPLYIRNTSGNRAVFGSSAALSAIKLTIPWPVGVLPRSSSDRTGTAF